MRPLNKSEMNVLSLLEQNCRIPANQIAKKTRLSPEGVLKIIKRLQDNNIIKKFTVKINYARMGYELYPVHIKLLKLNDKIMKEIKAIISKYAVCAWHMFCEGEYDLLLSFKVASKKNKKEMDRLLLELSDHILEKEVAIVLHAFEVGKSFDESQKLFTTFDHSVDKIDLSGKELNLINLLKKNSRDTVLNLANKLNSSAKSIISTIRKLENNKVITGFKTRMDTAKLGYQPCIALLRLGKYKEPQLKKFMTYCQHKQGIHYLVQRIGKYDIELTLDAKDVNEFYKIVDDLRNGFPFIEKITTLITK